MKVVIGLVLFGMLVVGCSWAPPPAVPTATAVPTPDARLACNEKIANVFEALDAIPPPRGIPTEAERTLAWDIIEFRLSSDEINWYVAWMQTANGFPYAQGNFRKVIEDLRSGEC